MKISNNSSMNPTNSLIFGFWKVPKDKCVDITYNAIKVGYRRLDCACDYGNEVEVGLGIKKALDDGIIKSRDELYVTSKLWNTYHKSEHVELAIDKTLEDLQLDYLDEYLIHFPISMEYVPIKDKYPPEWLNLDGKMNLINDGNFDIIGETWPAMEGLVTKQKTKHIGVCNFTIQLLRQLLSKAIIKPKTLQIELHPHNSQSKLIRFAHKQNLDVQGFSVLGASSYIDLNMATTNDLLLQDEQIYDVCKNHKGKTPAQILLRWAIQRNTLPICKSSSIDRMKENRNIFDFVLSEKDMLLIDSLNKNHRYNDPGVFCEQAFGTFCPIYE